MFKYSHEVSLMRDFQISQYTVKFILNTTIHRTKTDTSHNRDTQTHKQITITQTEGKKNTQMWFTSFVPQNSIY